MYVYIPRPVIPMHGLVYTVSVHAQLAASKALGIMKPLLSVNLCSENDAFGVLIYSIPDSPCVRASINRTFKKGPVLDKVEVCGYCMPPEIAYVFVVFI